MGSTDARMDSRFLEPIAIVGYSIGFPQDAVNSEALWEIMMNKRSTATEFPPDRLNANSVYHPDINRRGQIPVKRAHFLKEDLAAFDASFFSVSTTDAASMDPQQRQLLEHTYMALENAGLSIEAVSGSKTSVYTGSFSQDWMHLAYKDGEEAETTTALGVQACFIANRVSWFFNFKGNSANIDTACSSSLVCLDMGCQDLQSGSHDMSIVAGSNIMLSMDSFHTLTNLNMLSLDGQCYSFDHRGHGYGRGEGVGVLVLKRVSDAIRDNDTIRGIIRSSGCNQNGHTSSITLPNPSSQLALIRETYAKAGLSMKPTRFFEAHGTGTIVGDPNESKALGEAFRKFRTNTDPLWIGAIKANIGHLEGASGIAGVIKAMLVLEKGVIPPNTNFEKLNPKIDAEFLKIAFPLEAMPWPVKGLRRASVNSFGNAGTNSHVVLDDVFHFLKEHGVTASHLTVEDPPREPAIKNVQCNMSHSTNKSLEDVQRHPQVLVLSAHDKTGVQRQAQALGSYFTQNPSLLNSEYLDNLAYTLSFRRTALAWKSFAIVRSQADLLNLPLIISPPIRSSEIPGLAFIFTGQGAQWQGMAYELLQVPIFRQNVERAEIFLTKIGCTWSLWEELHRKQDSKMQMPQLSQPICTAIQIALIDMLSYFNVYPTSVIGHSSGEIAAAYSIQAITWEEALKIAYFRGLLSGELSSPGWKGAMMSVGLSPDEATPYIQRVTGQSECATGLTVACINSPRNITVSGDGNQVEILHQMLNDEGVFARKLAVEVAYHSPHMLAIADEYRKSIDTVGRDRVPLKKNITMFSSVTGLPASAEELASPDYWVKNLVSPVNFVGAVEALLSKSTRTVRRKLDLSHKTLSRLDMLVEIGPHSTLHVPLRETINKSSSPMKLEYTSLLKRNVSAIESSFTAIGSIKCSGYPVNLERLNNLRADYHNHYMTLPLPSYVFDHSNKFWTESRMSTQYRVSSQGKLDLLGKPTMDWNPESPRWRNHLRLSEMPWMEDHVIDGALIYPGAGMVVKVIEAANQVTAKVEGVLGFEFKDVSFLRPLRITRDAKGTETILTIHSVQNFPRPLDSWSEFTLSAYENLTWEECFRGYVRARYARKSNEIDNGKEEYAKIESYRSMKSSFVATTDSTIVPEEFYAAFARDGLGLGKSFHRILHGEYDEWNCVRGTLGLYEWPRDQYPQPHIIHPTSLDAAFHSAIAGYAQGGRRRIPTVIPAFLKSLFVSKYGLSFPESKEVYAMTWVDAENSRGIECRGGILDRDLNSLLIEFDGFRMSNITDDNQKKASEEALQHSPYCIVYQPDPDLLEDKHLVAHFKTSRTCDDTSLKRFIHLMSHKNPELRILEVDLGNSALTEGLLSTLSQSRHDGEIVSHSYSLYHFTSFDSVAIHTRKQELSKYLAVRLEQLRPGGDFISQGLEKDFYDVIIVPAMFVEHANAFEMFRPLLKTGGTLLGLTTGGQLATDGNDLEINSLQVSARPGSDADSTTELKIVRPSIQDTRFDSPFQSENSKSIRLVIDSSSEVQTQVASHIKVSLQAQGILDVQVTNLKDAGSSEECRTSMFVVLLELDAPFLYRIPKEEYQDLQKLLLSALDIVWVNFAGGTDTGNPEFSIVHGLARALRSEYEELEFTIISFEARDGLSEEQSQNLTRILFSKHINHNPSMPDSEYLEIGGALCIPRIFPAVDLSGDLNKRFSKQQNSVVAIRDAPPLMVNLETPGLLDTLRFVESQWTQDALQPDEIEVEVKAIGLNFRDCLAALGQLPNATFGQECAGIVVKSASTSFEIGDHVIAVGMGGFKTVLRSNATHAFKVPKQLPFATAAAIPVQFGTAKEVIHRVARMQSGESVLIHAGAGGTGQALIQVAQSLGAIVFATVSSQAKRDVLIKTYNIQESHIFYSRDTSFAQGIQRVTNGRGVDVVVNCLSGDSLLASWDCLAPYGRFVEIGLKDIMSNANLPMMKFGSNTSFHGFDGSLWMRDHLALARKGLEEIIHQFSVGTLHPPEPLIIHDISDVEKALRLLQEGTSAGKVVVEVSEDSLVPATINTRPSFMMDQNATFVIAGGLGGIGRATARWMADRGAKNLILLSRSGPRTDAGRDLIEELRQRDVRVETPACDVTDLTRMKETFAQLSAQMPPIKGVCQMSIVARDCLFMNMDYESWSVAVDCKSIGTWNLHTVLPAGMDFFLILSSISGLSGIRGQANYDAGNTYEDAFARYRVSQGEKCISLDLGAMLDDGILAEDRNLLTRVLTYGTLEGISRQMFYGMLDYYCNPSLQLLSPSESQVAIGIGTVNNDSLEGVSFSRQALMRHVAMDSSGKPGDTGLENTDQATGHRALFANASSLEDAAAVAAEAIIMKLAKSLVAMQDDTDIDRNKQLQLYGVDSLLAVELRNWIVKEFKADITVFEIQGASTLGTLSVSVAVKSTLRNSEQGTAEA